MYKKIVLSALSSALLASVAFAADVPVQDKDQIRAQQTTGRQLMTPEERNEHRNKMRNATSAEERREIRKEQHEKMKEKAKEKGVSIPDNPPTGGMGGGQGMRGGR